VAADLCSVGCIVVLSVCDRAFVLYVATGWPCIPLSNETSAANQPESSANSVEVHSFRR
jgi:hypothetical protein